LDILAANNTALKGTTLKKKKKKKLRQWLFTHLALDRDRQCHHAVTQWRQFLRLPAAGRWVMCYTASSSPAGGGA
jgi:hypothetical protein